MEFPSQLFHFQKDSSQEVEPQFWHCWKDTQLEPRGKTSTLELLEGSTTRVATSDITLILEGSIIRGVMLGIKSMVGSIGASISETIHTISINGYVYVKTRFNFYNPNDTTMCGVH